ncbi:MAG TPA: hypothetical protein VGN04_00400 [Herbaspirillum sp.]|jgi:hypothetical protein
MAMQRGGTKSMSPQMKTANTRLAVMIARNVLLEAYCLKRLPDAYCPIPMLAAVDTFTAGMPPAMQD